MSKEQFANTAVSVLASAMTDSAVALVVASASRFPTTPQFRILVDDELMLVTALSGATFTVTRAIENTTAVAHAANATVTHMVTAGALGHMILGVQNGLIFQPGGTPGPQVVTTWAEVQDFISLTNGACVVYVDDTFQSPALVPGSSGITDCAGKTEFREHLSDSVNWSVLQIEPGATLRNVAFVSTIEIRCNAQGGAPSLDWTGSPNGGALYMDDYAKLSRAATATSAGIVITSGSFGLFGRLAVIGEGGVVLEVGSGAAAYVEAYEACVLSNGWAKVDAGGTLTLSYDDATAFRFPSHNIPPTVTGPGSYTAFPQSRFLAVAKPTVTGSRGGNAALASLLTALANLGILTDSTTA